KTGLTGSPSSLWDLLREMFVVCSKEQLQSGGKYSHQVWAPFSPLASGAAF
ncbi:testis expressed 35, partial [Homo sapiens]